MANLDYTSRDYQSIREDLLNRASLYIPEWTSRNSADFGVLMVDLWAYYADILHYYVDRAATESVLDTATQLSSVMAIANLFDYKPAFSTSSTATVTVVASDAIHQDTIVIPKNTGFVAPASSNDNTVVYFTSTQAASMGPSVASVFVPVAEGRFVELESPIQYATGTSVSDGLAGQRFNLRYSGAIASSIEVYVYEGTVVNGSPTPIQYLYTSDLGSVPSSTKAFTLEMTADGVMQVIFGNNINGKIPTHNAEIKVSYRYGQGQLGNINAGRITQYNTGSSVLGTTILSSTAASGAVDSESINSIKKNIPLMIRTQNRAVSKQDFKDLALRIPSIVKSSCSVAGSNVMVYALPYVSNYENTVTNTLSISNDVQSNVITYFEPRAVVGASVGAASSVTLVPVNITATIHVLPEYVNELVKEKVSDVIDDFFTFDNVSFGQILPIGSLYRAIQNVEGVNYVIISTFSSTTGVSNTVSASEIQLLRKGTVNLTAQDGITGILVQ